MRPLFTIVFSFAMIALFAQPKLIDDYTVEMKAIITDASGKHVSEGVKTIYVSGKKVRSDYAGAQMQQSSITDHVLNSVVILRENAENKFMRTLNAENWKKENQRFENIRFQFTQETKKLLNYTCKKAIATLKDGSSLTVFYVPDLAVSYSENSYQFNGIPGLILEYEFRNADNAIHFTAINVNFDPIPASKFTVPTSGYRLIE